MAAKKTTVKKTTKIQKKTKPLSPLFEDKTKSNIPKTAREKKMWIESRRITAAMSGKEKRGAEEQKMTPGQWGLTNKIYQNALKSNKIPKLKDWEKAKPSKAVESYKKSPNKPKKKK